MTVAELRIKKLVTMFSEGDNNAINEMINDYALIIQGRKIGWKGDRIANGNFFASYFKDFHNDIKKSIVTNLELYCDNTGLHKDEILSIPNRVDRLARYRGELTNA